MKAKSKLGVVESVKKAVNAFDPNAEVILFGSRARGDWTQESDWDFLILLERENLEELKTAIRDAMFEIELYTEEVITTLIENKQDWALYHITPLYQNINEEGVVV